MQPSPIYIIMCMAFISLTQTTRAIDRNTLVSYASPLKGLSGAELKTAIYSNCQANRVLSYGSGSGSTWSGFYSTDRYDDTYCRDRYSLQTWTFTSTTAAISGMNIEHSFPKSWWGGEQNNAYKDLFNLMPCEAKINSSKSNYGMGIVTSVTTENGCTKVGKGTAGTNTNVPLWEPGDQWKGDFSRSYMYMATIYQNLASRYTDQALYSLQQDLYPTLQPWAYTLYLQWTRNDLVDEIETARNDAVYAIQGNRNLFVDFPYLAEYVWGDSVGVAFDPSTSITTATGDSRYNSTSPDDNPSVNPDDNPGGNINPAENQSDYYFAETFLKCDSTGGNDGLYSGSNVSNFLMSSDSADVKGWAFTKAYQARHCLKLGTSSAAGIATTPQFTGLTGGDFILTFDAAAWIGDNTTLTIIGENCTITPSTVALSSGQFTTHTIHVTDITGNIRITIQSAQTKKNRFFLDNVLIPRESIFLPDKQYIAGN